MKSKLLDFVRPSRKARGASPVRKTSEEDTPPRMPTEDVHERPQVVQRHATEVRGQVGYHYALISKWLRECEEDIERGRDNHEYSALAPVFEANGCTRIDDIPRMTTELIRQLAADAGVTVTIGLVNRVHQYAEEDVMRAKGKFV